MHPAASVALPHLRGMLKDRSAGEGPCKCRQRPVSVRRFGSPRWTFKALGYQKAEPNTAQQDISDLRFALICRVVLSMLICVNPCATAGLAKA